MPKSIRPAAPRQTRARLLTTTAAPTVEAAPPREKRRRAQPIAVAPEMCRAGDLNAWFGVSRTRAYALMREGAFRAVKVSPKLTLVEVASVREWLASQAPARFGRDPIRRAAKPASNPI